MSRWDSEIWYNPNGGIGRVSSRIGTYVSSLFLFDETLFGLSISESSMMDPQQRVLLEETANAFKSANLSLDTLVGTATGIYVGCIWLEYGDLLDGCGIPAGAHMVTGEIISYFM